MPYLITLSMVAQQNNSSVCTNAKFSESLEKVDTLLGLGAHIFNMYTPAEFAVSETCYTNCQ